jgi:hypothetical protein
MRFNPVRLLRVAAFLALAGLAFMVWSLLDPRPIPIMAAMSVGQGLGMLSFLLFAVVLIIDAWRTSRQVPAEAEPAAEAKPEAVAEPAVETTAVEGDA